MLGVVPVTCNLLAHKRGAADAGCSAASILVLPVPCAWPSKQTTVRAAPSHFAQNHLISYFDSTTVPSLDGHPRWDASACCTHRRARHATPSHLPASSAPPRLLRRSSPYTAPQQLRQPAAIGDLYCNMHNTSVYF